MDIFKELENEANKILNSGEVRLTPEEQQELFYQEQLKPILIRLHDNFMKLKEHLTIVKPEIYNKIFLTDTVPLDFRLTDFKITRNNVDNPTEISLRLVYIKPQITQKLIGSDSCNAFRDFLITTRNAVFDEKIIRSKEGVDIGRVFHLFNFQAIGEITFTANKTNKTVDMSHSPFYRNLSGKTSFTPENADSQWLNYIGSFLIGREDSLTPPKPVETLSSDVKYSLMQKLEQERKDRELEEAKNQRIAQLEAKEKSMSKKVKLFANQIQNKLASKTWKKENE